MPTKPIKKRQCYWLDHLNNAPVSSYPLGCADLLDHVTQGGKNIRFILHQHLIYVERWILKNRYLERSIKPLLYTSPN